jgi:hypothetical protein
MNRPSSLPLIQRALFSKVFSICYFFAGHSIIIRWLEQLGDKWTRGEGNVWIGRLSPLLFIAFFFPSFFYPFTARPAISFLLFHLFLVSPYPSVQEVKVLPLSSPFPLFLTNPKERTKKKKEREKNGGRIKVIEEKRTRIDLETTNN